MPHRPTPGSKPERDRLRQRVLGAGGSLAAVAMEMRARMRMRPREAWRHAHGWTLQQAADQLNELGARRPGEAVGADASLVAKWEKWPVTSSGRRPTLTVLLLMADTYQCPVEDLLDLEDRSQMPASDLRVLQMRRDRNSVEPVGVGREELATVPAEAPAADPVREAAEASARWAQWAEATNVGDLAIEQVFADIRALAGEYLSHDPRSVFLRTCRLRDRVWALLEGRQYPRQCADLYAAAGYLCGLLGWMTSDFGKLQEADTHGRTAWLCAQLAGRIDLQAWVLSTRSKIAFWDSRLRDAITYARQGAALTACGTAPVLLACQEADAWSQLGAAGEAQDALARAADARDRAQGADEVAGLYSCPELRRANYATAVQLRTGHAREALREAEHALDSAPFHAYGTLAQLHIARATAHLALRDPDGLEEALRPVLAIPSEHRMEPVVQRVRELATTLARSTVASSATAASIQGKIGEWCAQSASRQLALSPGADPG